MESLWRNGIIYGVSAKYGKVCLELIKRMSIIAITKANSSKETAKDITRQRKLYRILEKIEDIEE